MNNVFIATLKFVFIDIIGDFVYWPIWWYTTGLKNMLVFCGDQIKKIWGFLALGIWLKNMFTPMYADRSILGRLISFGVRIIILIWRLVWFFIWLALIISLLIAWLLGPVAVVWMITKH